MLIGLPIVAFAGSVAAFRSVRREWGDALILSSVLLGVVILASTELLSLGCHLTSFGVSAVWAAVCVATTALFWSRTDVTIRPPGVERVERSQASGLSNSDKALLVVIGLLVLLVGLDAIVSPPNSWDVIDYHLARVVMWISNRTVRFYPTLDFAQLINSPWAEYAATHLNLLFGSDRLTNLVTWGAFVGTIGGASLVARELGAETKGMVFAAVVCATIPSAVLEASGAMNDVVVSFWIIACLYLLIRYLRDETWISLLGAAGAAGLAVATKGTAYVILPPMALACWILGAGAFRPRVLVRLPVIALAVLLLNAFQWHRNIGLTGSSLGVAESISEGGAGAQLAAGRHTLRGAAANVIRNVTLHSSDITNQFSYYAYRAAVRTIAAMGADPNDPEYLWRNATDVNNYSQFRVNSPSRHETFSGNPLHLLVIGLACLISLLPGTKFDRKSAIYALGLVATFLLFCTMLRWLRWGARWQLPMFVVGSALAGVVLPRYFRQGAMVLVSWILVASALPYVLRNELRPLIPPHILPTEPFGIEPYAPSVWQRTRADLYFADQHEDLRDSYTAVAAALRGSSCREIGVDDSLEHYEYPIVALTEADGWRRHWEYVNVNNSSASKTPPTPCTVVCPGCANVLRKWTEHRDIGGRASVYGNTVVFSEDGQVPNTVPSIDPVSNVGDLRSAAAQMSRDMKTLRSEQSKPDNYLAYQRALEKHGGNPELETTLDSRFHAIDELGYDAQRVWGLTADARQRASEGLTQAQADELLDGGEAIAALLKAYPLAAADFAAYVDKLDGHSGGMVSVNEANK